MAKRMEKSRTRAMMNQNQLSDQNSSLYPGVYHGSDDTWNFKKFCKKLKMKVINYSKLSMEFDLIGVDPALANAFRRIMLSEVPSMAIEKIYMYNNTSIIPDEVLSHRMGLIPIKADPKLFEYRQEGDESVGTEQDTLEFELKIRCSWNPNRAPDASDPDKMYLNHKVFSKDLKWIPIGAQKEIYHSSQVGPVEKEILIAKLRPGHEIDMRIYAVKGIGKDHAKFSPVATAFYRLLPEITFKQPVEGDLADQFQQAFSPGVIKIENSNGKKTAKVHDARYDSCARNVFQIENAEDYVELTRVKDHFIFTIESVGALAPDVIFLDSIRILKGKCRNFLAEIKQGLSD